ncbi:MAG TPA: DNA-processing protein DprA [Clostridia bacterium]|nr:DNA-processing protein DprA [Clostridia bacterium]
MIGNIKYWIWLSSLVKISPRKRLQLLDYFGDPALIWEASEAELKSLNFVTPQMAGCILDRQSRKMVTRLYDDIGKCDADIITLQDGRYPEALRNIPDAPVVLYCRGKLEKEAVCIAIVGSRRATQYGLDMAGRLSRELAMHGLTIVSGMARGIDSKAHIGALEGGGKTIAVLGCGVDIVYPSENLELMKKICRSGAVISEYLPGTPPVAFNFPARNRIISGLSQGVAIVEANEKSGSLITADFALEQGRDVYAVPGNINSTNSLGTNRLIKDGAKMVTNAGDILDELKISHGETNHLCNTRKIPDSLLGNDEKSIAQRLQNGPAHIDTIARDCGISVQLAGSVLVMLELSGFVEQLPGKYYKLAE